MNTEALFIFIILLLGLVLCSFLGQSEGFSGSFTGNFETKNDNTNSNPVQPNFDNYNHYNKTSTSTQLTNGTSFYGKNGGSVMVKSNSDGTQYLEVVLENGQSPMTFQSQQSQTQDTSSNSITENYTNYSGNNGYANKFYGPRNSTATVINDNNGQQVVQVTTSSGTYTFTPQSSSSISSTQYFGSTGYPLQQGSYVNSYTGPNGNTAYTNNYPYSNNNNNVSSSQYYGPNGSVGQVTGPNDNSVYYAQSNNNSNLSTDGIPRNQIPAGQEDLYILKTQVVPPVCPACPSSSACPRQEKCPPCPACARCPEPSFECKKVPNYNAINPDLLPTPVLNDFSSFGM